MNSSFTTLIIARPGRMRSSLHALLLTIPGLGSVAQLNNWQTAQEKLNSLHSPALILLDANLPESEIKTILKQINNQSATVKSIVLVNNSRQQQTAIAMQANAVLLKGFSTATLLNTIEKITLELGIELTQ